MSSGERRVSRPRLVDVAARAGVSTAIASTVLNKRGDSNMRASPETAERIRTAARELGYSPNPAAQRLALGRNRILGVFTFEPIFPLAQQDFYHPFLLGIEQEAEEQDYDLLLFTSARTGGKKRQRKLFNGGSNRLALADGAVLLGREEDRSDVKRLIEVQYPFVYLGRREIDGLSVPYVGADYVTATADVVKHLASLGHTRFAYLGWLSDHEASSDRWAGYEAARADLGLSPDKAGRRRVQPTDVTGDVVRGWLSEGITALVVEDDMLATRVLAAAKAAGVAVPAELSVALLGDALHHVEDGTEWTMFRIPREAMGRHVVRSLVEVLETRQSGSTTVAHGNGAQVVMKCELVPGATAGPAPS